MGRSTSAIGREPLPLLSVLSCPTSSPDTERTTSSPDTERTTSSPDTERTTTLTTLTS